MDEKLIAANREYFLRFVKPQELSEVAKAIDLLIEFSKQHSGVLELSSTEGLDQPSIGFDLVNRQIILWKAYTTKLVVLPKSLRGFPPGDYSDFRALWHSIPGLKDQLKNVGVVPTVSLTAAAKPDIWKPLLASLEWGVRAADRVHEEP